MQPTSLGSELAGPVRVLTHDIDSPEEQTITVYSDIANAVRQQTFRLMMVQTHVVPVLFTPNNAGSTAG